MTERRSEDVKTQLRQLVERHAWNLDKSAWVFEEDRWTELVFCMLNQCSEQDSETIRKAVTLLNDLELLEVEKLSQLADPSQENTPVVTYVLKQHGFSDSELQRSLLLLVQISQAVRESYGGKIQRYMRRHGEAMRDELVRFFSGDTLNREQLRYALSHWLQNVFTLPISLEHRATVGFCEKNGVSLEEMWQAADELNINLALIDDLLEMDQAENDGSAEDPAKGVPKQ